ncbi:MAG: Na/Pi cotransporter family protein, partial [Firmicutes bacterium]|nr:Na/Pi cotransporter family protein [Bacillota bacterium]
ASVGILQGLCSSGVVTYGAAIPIILGQNIGTCITAILSSIGANKGAKRVAAVHLSFNLIGTVLFLAVFYIANAIVKFDFLGDAMDPWDISVIHSMFNIGVTIVLLPFTKALEALACKVVKETEEEKSKDTTLNLLEERFLESPDFAASQCRTVVVKMANLTRDCINAAMNLIDKFDRDKCDYVYLLEEKIDRYEDALGAYIVKLSRLDIGQEENRMLSMILHNIGDLERISDHAKNIAETAEELNTKGLEFSPSAKAEVAVFMDAVREIVDLAVNSFEQEDVVLAAEVEPLEDVIDMIHSGVKGRHVQRLQEGICTIEQGFILNDLGTNLERVADHCSNLAVGVIEQARGQFDMHHYLSDVKKFDADGFEEKMAKYRAKYALPM